MIKVYVAGKMYGEDYQKCFDKFQSVEDTLTGCGFNVINPMKIIPKGTIWSEALEDIKLHLLQANVVLFLPDWKDMCGSQMERLWAKRNDMRIVDWDNFPHELAKVEIELNKNGCSLSKTIA